MGHGPPHLTPGREALQPAGTSWAEAGERDENKAARPPLPPPDMLPAPQLIYFLLKRIMTNEKRLFIVFMGTQPYKPPK